MVSSNDKVIVAGCDHGGLAVMRSLGKRGLYIIAVTHDPEEFGTASRFVNEEVICPHPADTRAFANFLLERAQEWGDALIIETDDYYATAIAKHKPTLSRFYNVITPDWEHAQLFIQKDKTYELADACGVPHPRLHQPTTMEELDDISESLVFPLMVKPVQSHEFYNHFNTKLFVVEDMVQLREKFQQVLDANLAVMIQEIIPGTDEGTLESIELYINTSGEVSGEQFNIKLRQSPPMFGIMRVGESVPPIQDIREHAYNILKQINYRGFASFEFKRDRRDDLPKLIEVNIRHPRNGQLIIASGIDIPWLVYQDVMLNKRDLASDYNHIYYIDIIPDIGNTLFREPHLFLRPAKWLRPYLSGHKTFAVFSLSDPKPFLKLLWAKWHKFRRIVWKRLPKKDVVRWQANDDKAVLDQSTHSS